MAERTMTLAEALSLKKSFERKIEKRLSKIKLACLLVKSSDLKEHREYYDNYCNEMRATYQSLETMSKNYIILCSAIVVANAKTKTDMVKLDGNRYTIAELLSITSNSVIADIIESLDDGYSRARAKQAGKSDIIIVNPFKSTRNKMSKEVDAFKDEAEMAIQKANGKKKITVSFID